MTLIDPTKPRLPPADAQVLFTEEVAALLRCSRQFLYRAQQDGKFPKPRRLGSRPYWTRADLEPFFAQRATE